MAHSSHITQNKSTGGNFFFHFLCDICWTPKKKRWAFQEIKHTSLLWKKNSYYNMPSKYTRKIKFLRVLYGSEFGWWILPPLNWLKSTWDVCSCKLCVWPIVSYGPLSRVQSGIYWQTQVPTLPPRQTMISKDHQVHLKLWQATDGTLTQLINWGMEWTQSLSLQKISP